MARGEPSATGSKPVDFPSRGPQRQDPSRRIPGPALSGSSRRGHSGSGIAKLAVIMCGCSRPVCRVHRTIARRAQKSNKEYQYSLISIDEFIFVSLICSDKIATKRILPVSDPPIAPTSGNSCNAHSASASARPWGCSLQNRYTFMNLSYAKISIHFAA
jgi:hypothetical protein